MFLMDTNHTGFLLDNNPKFIQKLIEFGQVPIFSSVITAGELLYGAFNSKSSIKNIPRVKTFLTSIDLLTIDHNASEIYGKLKFDLFNKFGAKYVKRKKQKIAELGFSDNDLWIASIAKQNDLIVLTTDKKDFNRITEVLEIQFESWV